MLAVIDRYFFYKIQVHPEEDNEYYPADNLLLGSMVRTAAIYGATPPEDSLNKITTDLDESRNGWKRTAYDALKSWDRELNGEFDYQQQLCTIKIPAKHQPVSPKKPADDNSDFPPDVEDIKELGGQIFIKRNGHWRPWKKK